ncbi:MAG TPA: SUMF1/EgtB/PvdO family nonheme iron enzyme [Pyrinomonadaceae bacterium]|nr:SUMF1/EgtB/PvdO family nonheme iron enzyme [Pyrinomonadaceae bacterium]
MFCPGCGNTVTSGGRFCFNCGAELPSSTWPTAPAGNGRDAEETAEARAARRAGSLVGRFIENKYRVEGVIGAGGMGTVYRATRLLIGDEVAVKVLHAEFVRDQEAERFRREAQAAARIKHPNAVSVYDFGVTADGLLYLVMELVEGESLRQLIKARGSLEPAAAVEITRQVCAALEEAHHQSVVHRDVKPDNIVVRETPRGLRVKVLDFGVAKLRDVPVTTLTQTGSVVGTPHYMSPEQCVGEELDSRSDIYSLGVVLYEMLAGVVPFNSPISTAVIVQHVNQPPPSLRARNNRVTPQLERVVMHALEKRREARPETAAALAGEAEAALEGRLPSGDFAPGTGPEVVTAGAAWARRATGEEETTREAGHNVSAHGSAHGSGSQSAPTEVLRATPASGAAFPVGLAGAHALTGPRNVGGRRPLGVAAAAALLLVLLGGAGLVTFWLWPGEGGRVEGVARGEGGGKEAREANASATASPDAAAEKRGAGDAAANAPRDARASSPAPQPPPGMVYVPGGVFTMGSNDGDPYERPAHRVTVRPFFIGRHEVTCEEYARFLNETGRPRAPRGWKGRTHPPGAARLPVSGVTWDDAAAYARWAGGRLPTEEEWEFAARGTDGRRYPWGDDWRPGLANADDSGRARGGVAEVGTHEGESPFGARDMAGNVWEWTASPLAAYPGGSLPAHEPGDLRVIRGGYWGGRSQYVTTTYRGRVARGDTENIGNTGFRYAKDAPR